MHLAWETIPQRLLAWPLSSPCFSFLLGGNSIWCKESSVSSSYRTICSRVLSILWRRAGWAFLWISAGLSSLLYTAQPALGRAGSCRSWQTVKNFLTLGKPWPFSHKKRKEHYPCTAWNAGWSCEFKFTLFWSSCLSHTNLRRWCYHWLWKFASGSEVFWEYRIYEIIHLALLPEVGNFASHPFVFLKYGSWKARGLGYNWKCLRPQLKKLQYQSQNAVRIFFILLWLLLLTVLHFILALMIYSSKNSV